MADPVKPPDRRKPFQRINNDPFLPTAAPDGDGKAAGCHTPEDLGDIDKAFHDFFLSNTGLLGKLLGILEDVEKVAKAVASAAQAAAIAAATILAAFQAGAFSGPIGALIAAIGAAAAATKAIAGFLDSVLSVIKDAMELFMEKIGKRLVRRAIRFIPQWMPVKKGASNSRITADQIVEVEGIVTRSYGDPIESPFFQWHRWLNWSIQVSPEDKYKNVLANGVSNPPNTDGAEAGEVAIPRDGSFEIQWDNGALNEPLFGVGANPYETGFKEDQMPQNDGPMLDPDGVFSDGPDAFIWPMTGMFVWASGRWVYDCSRTTSGDPPRMNAMMNPPRAIATATWEAFSFAENLTGDAADGPSAVPAIRFMFFASKHGGYLEHSTVGEKDYEFILDLPPVAAPVSPYPIGSTPDFPHNTIVLRPRLLRALSPVRGAKLIDPIIQILAPEKPGDAPKQVKVTVPVSAMGSSGSMGFILSLGWADPNRTQAATVKRVTFAFSGLDGRLVLRDDPVKQIRDQFKKEEEEMRKEIADKVANLKIFGFKLDDIPVVPNPADPKHPLIDLGAILKKMVRDAVDAAIKALFDKLGEIVAGTTESEEWLMRFGVNGRWQVRYFKKLDKGAFAIPNAPSFRISLGPEDLLFYSIGGAEFNPVGDMMRDAHGNRRINLGDAEASWSEICAVSGDQRRDMAFQYAVKLLTGNSQTGILALGIENSPLGIVDPGQSPGNLPTSNPALVKSLQPTSTNLTLTANFARGTGEEFILVEKSNTPDYRVTALLQVANQTQQ